MKLFYASVFSLGLITSMGLAIPKVSAQTFTLDNAGDDGNLNIGVNAFGSIEGAYFNPVGLSSNTHTIASSYVSLGINQADGTQNRIYLNSTTETIPTFFNQLSSTEAQSSFTIGNLNFNLSQTLSSLFTQGTKTGSLLSQVYTITSNEAIAFDLTRYIDGDLSFNNSISDGGGIIGSSENLILFEADVNSDKTAYNANTFLGITAQGGNIVGGDRYQIINYYDLYQNIDNGNALTNSISNDSNQDGLIDLTNLADYGMGLRNFFSLGANETVTYTTNTIFGTGFVQNTNNTFLPGLPTIENPNGFVFEDVKPIPIEIIGCSPDDYNCDTITIDHPIEIRQCTPDDYNCDIIRIDDPIITLPPIVCITEPCLYPIDTSGGSDIQTWAPDPILLEPTQINSLDAASTPESNSVIGLFIFSSLAFWGRKINKI